MTTITDLYQRLFGKNHISDGDVISMSEHGRAGGISTGQGFKSVKEVQEVERIDIADSSTIYVGTAAISSATSAAVWQVCKFTTTDSSVIPTYADGDDEYDNIWDNRASLSYS